MKWFYPAQDEISKYLQDNHTEYECVRQHVTKYMVIEIFNIWSKTGNYHNLCFIINKNSTKDGYNWEVYGNPIGVS